MANYYKGHTKARTADLHRAYDEMERADAIKYAVNQLKYSKAGALSWISHWDKVDPKKAPAKKSKPATKTVPVKKVAVKKAPVRKAKVAPKSKVKQPVAA